MTTAEVAVRYGTNSSTARNWAAKNDVGRTLVGGILAFNWTEEDCLWFANRKGPGWQKGKPRKA
ncbi:MAG: hypothetical protein LBG90_05200 [Spirochaetaceae bacterium]|jgi:hypothetical protein|nr:hypothetical protein [Spirochaetaceae bacterium]